MPESPINDYLATLRRDLRAGDTTERSHYPTLKALIEALAPGASVTVEPKWSDWGAPDFHIRDRNNLIIGHIEAKNVGVSLDEAERSEQLKDRYLKAVENLILTDFLEFRWYVRGERRSVERLGTVESPTTVRTSASGRDSVLGLLRDSLSHTPQGAQDAKDLAVRLARLAHEIRNVVLAAINSGHESPTVTDLRRAMEQNLVPDLTAEQFSDMFAQTLTYGFFAAWCNHPINRRFTRRDAASEIPKTNPFLRDLFELMTGNAMDVEPFAGYVDDLVQLLDRTDKAAILADFGTRTGRADPVVHFYETFLKEYDPKLRELRGVYYTPEPVVSYMVRSVDHLLRTRFGCANGLADTGTVDYETQTDDGQRAKRKGPRVLILDPACGTGTFLYAIVDHIRDHLRRRRSAGSWSSYVKDQLLPRLFGFELLMAPYAVAHLKLGMQLAGQDLPDTEGPAWAYDFAADERLGVYLTNTLEEAARRSETLFGPLRIIAAEANAAAEIKRDKPIMVVIGNPPYSGHSANRSWQVSNGKRVPTFIGKLLQDYYQVDGQPLGERNPKWLQDDYAKFIRFGQWRIEQTAEQTGGGGILALITNHSYLDNPTFRGMRQQLMQAFTDIYVLDLHGNTRKKEVAPDGSKDENVFDIQQGVAIALFVKDPAATAPARVWHADLWGLRKAKEATLSESSCENVRWRRLTPTSPQCLFVPQNTALLPEYGEAYAVPTLFTLYSSTVTTARNDFAMAEHPAELANRIRVLRDQSLADDAVRERYSLKDVSYWSLHEARARLAGTAEVETLVRPYCYRPFDFRHVIFHGALCERMRDEVMRHMTSENVALLTHRPQSPATGFTFAYCTRMIGDQCVAANKSVGGGNSFQFPLYLYPDREKNATTISRDQKLKEAVDSVGRSGGDAQAQAEMSALVRRLFTDSEYPRWPNLNLLLLADLSDRLHLRFLPDGRGDLTETFGPEDVFDYIYAILSCPTYRSRYAEFLKRDFPRIPFTSDRAIFVALCARGAELVALHLMESPLLAGVMPDFPVTGSDTVERVHYNANEQRVYINNTQYFANIPSDVWSFHVGGYQVCEKWLKDRKGRSLSYDDQQHYQRIIAALRETIRLMAEIDALIPAWPIT
jgi:predicted helicase